MASIASGSYWLLEAIASTRTLSIRRLPDDPNPLGRGECNFLPLPFSADIMLEADILGSSGLPLLVGVLAAAGAPAVPVSASASTAPSSGPAAPIFPSGECCPALGEGSSEDLYLLRFTWRSSASFLRDDVGVEASFGSLDEPSAGMGTAPATSSLALASWPSRGKCYAEPGLAIGGASTALAPSASSASFSSLSLSLPLPLPLPSISSSSITVA